MVSTVDINQLSVLRKSEAANVVRVTLPIEAYFNLDKFQEAQRDVLGKLGCLACCSGWDIRYDIERNFVIGR